ncbi:hypothetical protein AC630_15745 [Bradyrhizobium sp. AS23.2]|nr:hypothetical protein AC630_15745 [Bradyrhizobium sp. AS23.2]
MSLAAELVAGELAHWFGLPIPPFAVINLSGEIEIPMIDGGPLLAGPAFISKEVDGFSGAAGISKISNPADVSRLIVFDTWVRNADRCAPEPFGYPPNYDNLFFTRSASKFQLTALDHSQAFVESGVEDSLSDPYLLTDDEVYGYFPEFADLVDSGAVMDAAGKLRQIVPATVHEIIASIPAAWAISDSARASWADVILARARAVADYLPPKLLVNPGLGL